MRADSEASTGAAAVGAAAKALVIGPYLTQGGAALARDPASRLAEAVGLAQAIDLDVVGELAIALSEVRPATYLGKGKVEEIAAIVEAKEAALVSMDCHEPGLIEGTGHTAVDRQTQRTQATGPQAHMGASEQPRGRIKRARRSPASGRIDIPGRPCLRGQ